MSPGTPVTYFKVRPGHSIPLPAIYVGPCENSKDKRNPKKVKIKLLPEGREMYVSPESLERVRCQGK